METIEQVQQPLADLGSFAEHKAARTAPPAGEPKEAPKEPPKTEEPIETPAPEAGKEATGASDTQEEQQGSKPRRDRSAEGRIKELIDENKDWKRRFEALEGDVKSLREKPPVEKTPPAEKAKEEAEPLLEDFEKDPKYTTYAQAVQAWANARDDFRAQKQRDASSKTELEKAREQIAERYRARVTEVKKTKADFDEVARSIDWRQATPTMQQTLLESDFSADLSYYFGEHPEEFSRIEAIPSPIRQVAEMALIEHSLKTPEKPKPAVTPVSKVPPPRKPLGGVSEPEPKNTSEAGSFAEHKRLRGR